MSTRRLNRLFSAGMASLLTSAPLVLAQETPSLTPVPVSMIVTVEARQGTTFPAINRENVRVLLQSHTSAQITDWVPLQGDRAGLDLFILLDDSRRTSYGAQVEDLRHFIMAQPDTTKVGIAYMQMSGPKIVQGLTTDHALAATAVRTSLSNLANSPSPYESLGQLIDQWPSGTARREVLMISNGVDQVFGEEHQNLDNPYADAAIEKAQRAGVVVFAIATSNDEIGAQQNNDLAKYSLARVAQETGGEIYYYQSAAPASFVPYLDDSTWRLAHQYLITFLARPGKKPGLQGVKLRTDVPHTVLVSAEKVYVPAAP